MTNALHSTEFLFSDAGSEHESFFSALTQFRSEFRKELGKKFRLRIEFPFGYYRDLSGKLHEIIVSEYAVWSSGSEGHIISSKLVETLRSQQQAKYGENYVELDDFYVEGSTTTILPSNVTDGDGVDNIAVLNTWIRISGSRWQEKTKFHVLNEENMPHQIVLSGDSFVELFDAVESRQSFLKRLFRNQAPRETRTGQPILPPSIDDV